MFELAVNECSWMFGCKVGSCLSAWLVFDQQNIHRKTLRKIFGVAKLQRIILKSKCAVSEREILLKIEKNERWAGRADQEHVNNLPLARQFALTAVKRQMFGGKTRHVWHPIRTRCFVSRPRLDGTDGNHWYISWAPYQLIIWFAYSSLSIIRKSLYCSFMARKLYALALEKCAAESADSPMMQEVLLGGHLYLMSLKVGQDTVKFRK